MNTQSFLLLLAALAFSPATLAASPEELQAALLAEARQGKPALAAFSAERGRAFFNARHGGEWSCASCHGSDTAQGGTHVVTRKSIDALAPAANPRRFSDAAKVEKWFRRNCKDVLARACSAEEKGDVLAYLLTIRP